MKKTREQEILKLLEESSSQFVSIKELSDYFKTSESTIRREIQKMADNHKIIRMHGKVASLHYSGDFHFERLDKEYLEREQSEIDTKRIIAREASKFIKEGYCIYLDASTTVASMVPFLPTYKNTYYVTNSPLLAQKLAERDLTCYVTGGEIKLTTNAFIGSYAVDFINRFNYNIGFFGTNGIHHNAKFTTPDPQEALIKETAINKCYNIYILADHTKFDNIANATFADFSRPILISDAINEKYRSLIKSIEVKIK